MVVHDHYLLHIDEMFKPVSKCSKIYPSRELCKSQYTFDKMHIFWETMECIQKIGFFGTYFSGVNILTFGRFICLFLRTLREESNGAIKEIRCSPFQGQIS